MDESSAFKSCLMDIVISSIIRIIGLWWISLIVMTGVCVCVCVCLCVWESSYVHVFELMIQCRLVLSHFLAPFTSSLTASAALLDATNYWEYTSTTQTWTHTHTYTHTYTHSFIALSVASQCCIVSQRSSRLADHVLTAWGSQNRRKHCWATHTLT